MSDSEEEFASADEGDNTDKHASTTQNTSGQLPACQEAPIAVEGDGAKPEMPDNSTPVKSSQNKDKENSSGKGKNYKQNKKTKKKRKDLTHGKEETVNEVSNSRNKMADSATTQISGELPAEADSRDAEEKKEIAYPETQSEVNNKQSTPIRSGDDLAESLEVEVKDQLNDKDVKGDNSIETAVLDQSIDRDMPSQLDSSVTSEEDNSQQESTSGSRGWSSWGTYIVSAASASVSTFTHQVGEGVTAVLDTVETTLGAPSPEELVKINQKSDEKSKQGEEENTAEAVADSEKHSVGDNSERSRYEDVNKKEKSNSGGVGGEGSWLSGWGVSSLTHLVSDAGKNLVTGGLDVLETIGKKTYDVLSEHDPGLKEAIKGDNKPNLSSVLRDAKVKAEEQSRLEEEFAESRQTQFGAMFDEYQGLVHLEALEMLSNQSENRVQALLVTALPDSLQVNKQKLVHLKEAFQLEELEDDEDDVEHDFAKLISDHLSQFHKATSPAKLNAVQAKIAGWITNFSSSAEGTTRNSREIYKVSIQSLAELTAKTVEQYHKAGELLLLKNDKQIDMLERAKALASVTRVVCTEIGILSTKLTSCVSEADEGIEDSDSINAYITNIYLEASNSSTYIQDAFQLLLPVLQQATLEENLTES